MEEDYISNYLIAVLKTKFKINEEYANLIKDYLEFRFSFENGFFLKERDNGLRMFPSSGSEFYLADISIIEKPEWHIRIQYLNWDIKESIEVLDVYEDGIMGNLKSIDTNLETLFRNNIIVPDSKNKLDIISMEDKKPSEILKKGIEEHQLLANKLKRKRNV